VHIQHFSSILLKISYKNSHIEAIPVEEVLGTFGGAQVGCLALSQQKQPVKLGKYLKICLTGLFFKPLFLIMVYHLINKISFW
jgi:hypothetical protein